MLILRKHYRYKNLLVEVTKKIGKNQYVGHITGVPSYRKSFITTNKKNIQKAVTELGEDCTVYLKTLQLPEKSILKLDEDEKIIAHSGLSPFGKTMYILGAYNWNITRIRIIHPIGFIAFLCILLTLPVIIYATGISFTELINETFDEFCLWD